MRAIAGYGGTPIVALALALSPHVFVRPGELRQAEWAEFDSDAAVWRIPAARMKKRREHVVPLSRQATAILVDRYENPPYRLNHLKAIQAPTVILQGEADPIVPVAAAKELAAQIPGQTYGSFLVSATTHRLP